VAEKRCARLKYGTILCGGHLGEISYQGKEGKWYVDSICGICGKSAELYPMEIEPPTTQSKEPKKKLSFSSL